MSSPPPAAPDAGDGNAPGAPVPGATRANDPGGPAAGAGTLPRAAEPWPRRDVRTLGPQCQVGEAPTWDAESGALWFIDVRAPALHRWHAASGALARWPLPAAIGAFALSTRGDVVVALRTGLHRMALDTGACTLLAQPEADREHNRLNDGKVSPCGRYFVFGSMHDRPVRAPTGALYRLDIAGRCERLADGLCVSNGLAWSPDARVLYHSDSHLGVIHAWDWDADTGTVHRRRVFARADEATGRPDGAAVDRDGDYWSAGVSAGVLNRFAPDGTLRARYALPVRFPTMPAFGGPALATLYVTSLVRPDTAPGPCDGRVLELPASVAGMPVPRFLG